MYKILTKILITVMIVVDSYYLFHAFQIGDMSRVSTFLVLFPILMLPTLLKRIFHLNISPTLEFVYLIFIFLAQFLGSVVNLYNQIDWFDTFTHGLSGILTGFVALIVLVLFQQDPTKKILFHITYILGIVFLIAGLWEFFEFGMDQFIGSNLQHWQDTSVEDTMFDILSAFVGSIIFLIFYVKEMISKKDGFFHQFIRSAKDII